MAEHSDKDLERDVEKGNGNMEPGHAAVSVSQAEADFAELRKELSNLSRVSRRKSNRIASDQPDPEKTASSTDETDSFDLEAILRDGLNYVGKKHIGVYWNDLLVKGTGGTDVRYIKGFMNTFLEFFGVRWLMSLLKNQPESIIMRGSSGVCKPGEMVLVLGKPASGCTTWLKAISNQRNTFSSVGGEVLYGTYDAAEFSQRFRGEAVFNDEMDAHVPSLTVEQTLAFALDLRLPSNLPEGFPSRKEFKAHVVTTLLRMFNVEHTRHTVVGDHLIRGISGGEKRRLSIAEMMVTRASVLAWDNSTRGLDSATALDFVRSARVLTNLYRTSTFITLYQASENMFREFDKVLVLDAGRQVYFGPTKEARSYFIGLGFQDAPRQTTPDFLTACTDQFERAYAEGWGPHNAPHNAETLAQAFLDSDVHAALRREMAAYKDSLDHQSAKRDEFKVAVKESKRASSTVYSVGFHLQLWALIKRQYLRKLQDGLALMILYSRCIIIGLVFGSLYYKLSLESSGAFPRSSVCFMLILFNAFASYSDMGASMAGRPILAKHKAFALYQPSALWIANALVDQLFAAVQTLSICLIVYFMSGFVRTAGAFLTFYIFALAANMSFSLVFKLFGAISKDSQRSSFFANVFTTVLILSSGYSIQYEVMPRWIRWTNWFNTIAMSFMGTMQNEFDRITLECAGESLIPSGPTYDNISHQVCTLRGSVAGTLAVKGSDYIEQMYSIHPGDEWRNFGIIIAVVAALLLLSVVLGELLTFESSSRSLKIYQKPNAERKVLNEALELRRQKRSMGCRTADDHQAKVTTSESILTWERLCYDVPTPKGQKRLLHDIYGYVAPEKLTALMGASGAGKTTLLDVLAQRKNVGVISGDGILVDGLALPKDFQRSTSYAEQQDVHEATQTVREALRFSADLRQPRETSQVEKYAYVEEVIALLEMEDIADSVIGKLELGLTIEQRKRVTIGVELCAKPELLLFLDEPTSGLDSQGAFNIIRYLRKLAARGQAILCTIHQPNAALFGSFDRLLLLQRPGRTVYFGDIGEDGAVLRAYFARNGAVARPDENIAEFMLEAIGAGTTGRVGTRDWADIWDESDEAARLRDEIVQLKRQRQAAIAAGAHSMGTGKSAAEMREYATPFLAQLRAVTRRMLVAYYRDESYGFIKILNHVVIGVLNAGAFVQLTQSRTGMQTRIFLSFQTAVLVFLILASCESMYHNKRAVFFREDASKMYSPAVFAISITLAEIPFAVLSASLFFLPIYYMPLQQDGDKPLYMWIVLLVVEFFAITLGFALSAITPTSFITEQVNPFFLVTMTQFCGVSMPPPQMPAFWRSWLYHLDPITYQVEGLVTTLLHNQPVVCEHAELNSFTPPQNGSSCADYMDDFFAAGGTGYLVHPDAVDRCDYCAYAVGDEYYRPFEMSYDNRWRDVGILCVFTGANVLILLLAIRFFNFNKR